MRLLKGFEVLCTSSEGRDALRVTELPEAQWGGLEWTSVEYEDACSSRHCPYEPGPHHPRTCCELEEPVVWGEITVEDVFLFKLEKQWAGGVNNGFGEAGRSGGIQDYKRMIEREGGEFQVGRWD